MAESSARVIVLIVLVLLVDLPAAQTTASDILIQPLEGWAWQGPIIPVKIDSAATSQMRGIVLDAMNTWNSAQSWFRDNYKLTDGHGYSFAENYTRVTSVVSVYFSLQTLGVHAGVTYCPYQTNPQRQFMKIQCTIDISLVAPGGQQYNQDQLKVIVMHELGHALGLNHTSVSGDLMNPNLSSRSSEPSTLNLYGVYVISTAASQRDIPSIVALPSQISYVQAYGGVPGFSPAAIIVGILSAAFIVILRKRNLSRKKSQLLDNHAA